MPLAKLLFREKTNVPVKTTITFNAPGIYYPPYGKTSFLMQGQGASGNAEVPAQVSGYNPAYSYYAGTNADVAGNPATVNAHKYVTYMSLVFGQWNPGENAPAGSFAYAYSILQTSYPLPSNTLTYGGTPYGQTLTQYGLLNVITSNPITPGTAYYTYVPAQTYYNSYVPANTGASSNILGVTLPGGEGGAATVIGYVPISTVSYTNVGVPISVPSGGYVKIQNI